MIPIDWSRAATEPRQHQKDGVQVLLAPSGPLQIYGLLLGDEVGAGKSKQIVDTAQILFESREIDCVVVVGPAMARGVWANPNPALGEVAKHSWPSVAYACREYSVLDGDMGRHKALSSNRDQAALIKEPFLRWVVTNYEFIRREERLLPLLSYLIHRKFLLVCDEAWALADQETEQWKATYQIRRLAKRVVLLNGTPVADSPQDLNAQMRMLDERILGFPYVTRRGQRKVSCANYRFRHYYAETAERPTQEDLKLWRQRPLKDRWPRLEELRAKVEPYTLRRKTRDCFDLPPVLEPILLEARMKDEPTWRMYKQMRTDMIAWLDDKTASVAKQAMVRSLRLSQITSGFLGGITTVDMSEYGMLNYDDAADAATVVATIKEIGREKLDTFLTWFEAQEQPNRLLVWCQFRAEIERTAAALAATGRRTRMLYGEQSRQDRQDAIASLNPAIDPGEPVAVVGQPQAGGAGLNLAGASLAVSLSHGTSLRLYLQKYGRIDRLGQTQPIRYVDVVATGPKGQRTIDHHILAALRDKEDIANWTTATWRRKLQEE